MVRKVLSLRTRKWAVKMCIELRAPLGMSSRMPSHEVSSSARGHRLCGSAVCGVKILPPESTGNHHSTVSSSFHPTVIRVTTPS